VSGHASPLLDHIGGQRARIERAMLDSVATTDAHLTELASHLIVAGGKRLRPVLTVISGSLDGRPVTDDVVLGGVSCELVHLGSLYHDDVMDESETRRGVETVNAKWGNLQAILAGDFLLARASEIAAGLGTEVAGLLARTIGWLCEGQIEELRHTYDIGRSEESYLASIHGKTASLYGTAARVGGLVAGLDGDEVDALTDYGNAYGMVFQIVDDLLDLTASDDRLGKRAGHDMEVGVYTLPVIHTLAAGSDELAELLGGPIDGDRSARALEIVRNGPGIGSSVERAERFVAAAVTACSRLAPGPARTALEAAPAALLATVLSPTG
jgi:heptaprenyl diphosphate synthase